MGDDEQNQTQENGETGPEPLKVRAEEQSTVGESVGIELTRVPRRLLETAAEHIKAGRYQESVLIAQAGAEACAARAVTALLGQHPARLQEALRAAFRDHSDYNLRGKGAQKVWTFLTGDEIQAQPFWDRYKRHTERRNRVAHNTVDLVKADADDSLKAATEFFDRVEQVTDRILGPNVW